MASSFTDWRFQSTHWIKKTWMLDSIPEENPNDSLVQFCTAVAGFIFFLFLFFFFLSSRWSSNGSFPPHGGAGPQRVAAGFNQNRQVGIGVQSGLAHRPPSSADCGPASINCRSPNTHTHTHTHPATPKRHLFFGFRRLWATRSDSFSRFFPFLGVWCNFGSNSFHPVGLVFIAPFDDCFFSFEVAFVSLGSFSSQLGKFLEQRHCFQSDIRIQWNLFSIFVQGSILDPLLTSFSSSVYRNRSDSSVYFPHDHVIN